MWKWAEEKKCDILGLYLASSIVILAVCFKLNNSVGAYGICMCLAWENGGAIIGMVNVERRRYFGSQL